MSIRRVLSVATLTAALLVPVVSLADPPSSSGSCVLTKHRITSVQPYHSGIERQWGAQFYVLAEPGLTAEWLQLDLSQRSNERHGAGMRGCGIDMKGTRVEVESAGTGFRVKLIAKDAKMARELLRRVRELVPARASERGV